MLELEVYAADRGARDKVLELNQPTIMFWEIRTIFRKLALDPRFAGAIPAELRLKPKTQPLRV